MMSAEYRSSETNTPELRSRRSLFGVAACGSAAALLAGCSFPVRGPAVPIGRTTQATVLGIPNERFFPLYGTDALEMEFAAAGNRQRQTLGLAPDGLLPEL